ncbi:MAG: glutathione S-transferase family protein [Pseudomonadota bacterium]
MTIMETKQTVTAERVRALAIAARAAVGAPARRRMVDAAGALTAPGETAEAEAEAETDFELFHFGLSICSNKVRTVLGEKRVAWRSNELDPPRHENYHADYVRLRLVSAAARAVGPATGWQGGSSVAETGFDALVVPTLVDHRQGSVIADSREICLHLARTVEGGTDLLPADLEAEILAELDAVDRTPHVALLYGADPDGDRRPLFFRLGFRGEHRRKVTAVARAWDSVRGQDPALDAAYGAKIAKETAGGAFVADPQRMRAAVADTRAIVARFAARLGESGGPWLFGERFTLADAVWSVSLFRLQFLGFERLWQDDRAVMAYTHRAFARPAMNAAVARWPSQFWSRPVAPWMRRPTLVDRLMALGS